MYSFIHYILLNMTRVGLPTLPSNTTVIGPPPSYRTHFFGDLPTHRIRKLLASIHHPTERNLLATNPPIQHKSYWPLATISWNTFYWYPIYQSNTKPVSLLTLLLIELGLLSTSHQPRLQHIL